jgi:cell division protein FtsL
MSNFKIIKEDKKGNIEKAVIEGVVFYAKIMEPSVIYDQKDMPKSQQDQFEWSVELVVDEDTADEYDESVSDKQSAKKVLKAALAKKYRLTDDDGNADDEKFKEVGLDPSHKKFFVIKKAQRCQKQDGGSLKSLQPRVVEMVDDKGVDITFEKLVGNGSKAALLMRYADQGSYGVSSYPAILKVTSLIEYVSTGGQQALSAEEEDFLGGSVEFADAPENSSVKSQAADDEVFEEGEDDTEY